MLKDRFDKIVVQEISEWLNSLYGIEVKSYDELEEEFNNYCSVDTLENLTKWYNEYEDKFTTEDVKSFDNVKLLSNGLYLNLA